MKKTFKYILTVVLSAFFGIQMNAQNGAVVLDKNVTDNEDGTYSLTLESYVTGKTVWKPMDIVLVLDNSNSMHQRGSNYSLEGENNGTARMTALKNAVETFITSISGTANHNLAIVEFEGGGRRIDHYMTIDPTNLRAYDLGQKTNLTGITKKTWMDLSTASTVNGSDASNAIKIVKDLKQNYLSPVSGDTGTPAADGFHLANILLSDPAIAKDGREKIVIFFTDGCCGTSEKWGKDEGGDYYKTTYNSRGQETARDYNGYPAGYVTPNRLYATKVVEEANKLKSKATIFSIGTFGNKTLEDDDQKKDTYFYLRHTSSEYTNEIRVDGYEGKTPGFKERDEDWRNDKDEKGNLKWELPNPEINKDGTAAETGYKYTEVFHSTDGGKDTSATLNDDYVYSANSATEINNAFAEIASLIKSSAELGGETTVVLDALTNMFKLPENATVDNINLYTCNVKTGVNTLTWATSGTGGETHYKDSDNKDLGTTEVAGARAEYWVPWTPWTSGTHNKDYYIHVNPTNPVASDIASDSDVIEVTGYDFASNCVAKDANNNNYKQGQKLIIQFIIETDPANTGGINLKTNDPASGIYEKTGDNTYEIFLGYEQPEVYLPYIKIIKTGLEQHESAAFRITKVTGLDGATPSSDETEFNAIVMLSQDKTDKSAVEAIVKLIYTGFYRVEELDWSWTYTRGAAQVKELSTIKQDTFDETGYLVYEFSNTKNTSTNGNAAEWCVINEMGL